MIAMKLTVFFRLLVLISPTDAMLTLSSGQQKPQEPGDEEMSIKLPDITKMAKAVKSEKYKVSCR